MSNWSQRIASRFKLLRRIKNPSDALLILHVAIFAALVPLLMRLPLATVSRLVTPRRAPVTPDPKRVAQLEALVPAVLQAGRPLLRTHCLPLGLTLYHFLRRAGVEVELCFGMGAQGPGYSGHCWLRLYDMPYLERRDPRPRYAEFFRIPGGPVSESLPASRSLVEGARGVG